MINNSTYGSSYASRRSDIVTTASVVNSAASSRASSGRISGPTMREGSGWSTPSKASTSFYSAKTHISDDNVPPQPSSERSMVVPLQSIYQKSPSTNSKGSATSNSSLERAHTRLDELVPRLEAALANIDANEDSRSMRSEGSATSNSSVERAKARVESLTIIDKGEGSTSAPLQDSYEKTPSMRSEASVARSYNANEDEEELEGLRARLEAIRSFSPGSKSARSHAASEGSDTGVYQYVPPNASSSGYVKPDSSYASRQRSTSTTTPTMRAKPAASETSGYVKPDSSYASKRSTSTYASRKSQNLYGKDSGFAPTPEDVERLGLTYQKSNRSLVSTRTGSSNVAPSWKHAYSTHTWRNKDGSVHTSLMDWDERFLKEDLNIPRANSAWSKAKSVSSKASRAVSKTAKNMRSRLGTIFE